MAANDIRSLTDPSVTTPGSMGNQVFGKIVVSANRNSRKKLGGRTSGETGPHADIDPNNIVAKFDERFDDPTYYG